MEKITFRRVIDTSGIDFNDPETKRIMESVRNDMEEMHKQRMAALFFIGRSLPPDPECGCRGVHYCGRIA